MIINNFFNLEPFVNLFLTYFFLADIAQLVDFSRLWIACLTDIFEINQHFEFARNLFPFVLSYIFWAQLHFASFDVVTKLNEGRVKLKSIFGRQWISTLDISVTSFFFKVLCS